MATSTDRPTPTAPAASSSPAAMAPAAFDTATILSVSSAHLIHDTYPAFIGVLMPLLIPALGINLAAAGLLAATFRVGTAVQPVLGHIADHVDTRFWIVLTPAATAVAISLLGLAPSPWLVALLLVLAGLSSAVFHPAAAALVTRSSGTEWGRGTSIFMTGGESGRALGPLLIAVVLSAVGLAGSWIALVPGVLASAVLLARLAPRAELRVRPPAASIRGGIREVRRPFLLVSAASALLSVATSGLLVFIPTYLTDAGAGLVLAGAAVTVFEIGGAAGALAGGTMSDRFGRRPTLAVAAGAGAVPLIAALALPAGPAILPFLAVAGVLLLSAGPVELVLMQELLPHNRSTAVGLSIFVTTVATAVGSIAVGALGQAIGLQAALLLTAGVAFLALPFIALMPETSHVSRQAV